MFTVSNRLPGLLQAIVQPYGKLFYIISFPDQSTDSHWDPIMIPVVVRIFETRDSPQIGFPD